MENLNLYIGCLMVVLVTGYRFNLAPPPKPSLPEKIPRQVGTILNWFQFKKGTSSPLFPPPRANTTLFKFWLYRAAFTLFGLLVYLAIYKFPKLADEVQNIINLATRSNLPVLKNSGPVVMAFIVSVVFPIIPPFMGADRSLRRILFDRASIPAQQLRERNRLRKADYEARPKVLDVVKKNLQADGFAAQDIVYEAIPSTRSLWTKISLINDLIALGLVLSGVCLLPLSARVGIGRAVMITGIIFAAVLIPILIADRFAGAFCCINRQPNSNRELPRYHRTQRSSALLCLGLSFGCRDLFNLHDWSNGHFCHAEAVRVAAGCGRRCAVGPVNPAGARIRCPRFFCTDVVPGKIAQDEGGCFRQTGC